MKQYLDLCKDILENGAVKEDRTGTGTKSVFGRQIRVDLSEGFPLVTTKEVKFELIVSELLWFISGDTNIRYLLQHNNNIWNEWPFKSWTESDSYDGPDMTNFGHRSQVDPEFRKVYREQMNIFKRRILEDDEFAEKFGGIGDGYGKQWRRWVTSTGDTIDQLYNAIEMIKNSPDSRRIIVSAWNPEDVPKAVLPPCHTLFQFYVESGKLSCHLYQRSCDVFLGMPFNIASYSLLTHLVAAECGLEVGEFVHTTSDTHIYLNHIEQVKTQIEREPKRLPKIVLNPDVKSIFDYTPNDIVIANYMPHPAIKAPISV